MKTLLLDTDAWDIVLTAGGDIAVATNPYAIAQDVASECRLFLGECFYDTTRGVAYLQQFLGKSPPVAVLQDDLQQAALRTPEVVSASVVFESFENRQVGGSVRFTDASGQTQQVAIG